MVGLVMLGLLLAGLIGLFAIAFRSVVCEGVRRDGWGWRPLFGLLLAGVLIGVTGLFTWLALS